MRWILLGGIHRLEPGREASGQKTFSPDEDLFADHFPGFPVVPGVLILEALAQLGGKLIGYTVRRERGDWPLPILSMMSGVKFRRFVRPGQVLELHASMTALREEMADIHVRARVGGELAAQADQIFVFNALPLADPDHLRRLEEEEFGWLARLWPACPPDLIRGDT